MEKRDVIHLEAQIKQLRGNLSGLADGKPFEELLVIIHKPGFTTPAEALLLTGLVDSMIEQTNCLSGLKQLLLNASAKVELNPQPLPPKTSKAG